MEWKFALRAVPLRSRRWPAVVVGLGPIGRELARLVLSRPELFRLVAAVDLAPELAGKRLSALLGRRAPDLRVRTSVPPAPYAEGLAFLTTTSTLRSASATILSLLESGYHVVSSTEELAYPGLRAPELAADIARAARRARRCVVGTGINPGFAMDVWPLVLASNMQELSSVRVTRVVDASERREPLQRKVGSGLRRPEFEALARSRRIGHVGLAESCAHLAATLGWSLDTLVENLRPKIAPRRIRSAYFDVPAGRVSGIHHRAVGYEGRKRRVILDLQMYLGAPDARDEVVLDGRPPLRCVVPGGFHGDRTTAAQLLSAAARLDGMRPGLHLASDLPAPRWPAARLALHFAASGT
jgi:4-hydroxy-tetrahydrodipicolinate reductase